MSGVRCSDDERAPVTRLREAAGAVMAWYFGPGGHKVSSADRLSLFGELRDALAEPPPPPPNGPATSPRLLMLLASLQPSQTPNPVITPSTQIKASRSPYSLSAPPTTALSEPS